MKHLDRLLHQVLAIARDGQHVHGLVERGVRILAGPKRGANRLQVLDELQLAVVGCCTEGEMLKHVCDPALSLLLLERAHAHGEPQRDALLRLVVLFDVIAQAAGKAAASDVRVLRQRHGCARDQQWLEVLEGARRRCVVVLFCLRVVLLRRLHRGGGGGGGVLLGRLLVVVARAVVASPRRGEGRRTFRLFHPQLSDVFPPTHKATGRPHGERSEPLEGLPFSQARGFATTTTAFAAEWLLGE